MDSDPRIYIKLEINRGQFRLLMALLTLAVAGTELSSENVTLTTYYPAPSGVYRTMIATDRIIWGSQSTGQSVLYTAPESGGGIELGATGGDANAIANGTPHIDFHFGNQKAEDWNARIINSNDGRLGFFAVGPAPIFQFGDPTPNNSRVQINGLIQINNALKGNGKVLTSDANGTASWEKACEIVTAPNCPAVAGWHPPCPAGMSKPKPTSYLDPLEGTNDPACRRSMTFCCPL